MADVCTGVDQSDCELILILRRCFDYIDAVARIKSTRAAVRDEKRKAEVIANARATASAQGLPDDVIASLWDALVEASIAFEFDEYDRRPFAP